MRKHQGFTLIELLVVIAILSLLMSILVPSLRWAREQALRTRCAANLRDIGKALFMYADTYDHRLPPGSFRGEDQQNPWLSYIAYNVDTSAPEGSHIVGGPWNLAYLYEAKLCPQPEVFYCPGAKHLGFTAKGAELGGIRFNTYDCFHSQDHPWPWNTIGETLVRTGYNYFPQSKQKEDVGARRAIGRQWKLPKYTDSIHELSNLHTVVTDMIHFRNQLPHGQGDKARGINALFGDGHVNFSTNREVFDPDECWPANDPIKFRRIVSRLEP